MTRSRGGVCIVVENAPVPRDRRVWTQATTLRDVGIPVVVVAPRGDGQPLREVRDGIPIYRFSLPEGKSASGILREYAEAMLRLPLLLARVWWAHRPLVIQLCNPPDILFPFGLAWRALGGRFVFDHHDLAPEVCESRFRGLFRRLTVTLTRAAEWLTFRSANAVISTNESYAELARARGGVPAARVTVVRNGPDIRRFQVRPLPDPDRGERIVCCAGLCGFEDGWDLLVRAAAVIVVDRGRTDVTFHLLGDGPLLDDVRHLAARLGVSASIDFAGWISDDAVLTNRLAAADVCVIPEPSNPQNDRSTFVKTMEYLAVGRPVVAFDLLETRRSAGPAGRYARPNDPVSLADAILAVLDDPDMASEMAAVGMERVRTSLSWQVQGTRYVEVMRRELSVATRRSKRSR